MSGRVHLPLAGATATMPTIQAPWIAGILAGAPLPEEPNATCDACAMLPDEGAPPTGGLWFNPATRCCTYLPELANFLLGAALEAGGEAARSVRTRLAETPAVSPLGLFQDDAFRAAYYGTPEDFGRAEALVCPHFHDGRCTVWAHREATCATWFCKHTRGAVHKAFWNRLHQATQRMERAVALHCAVALGLPVEGLAALVPLGGPEGRARAHDVLTPRDRADPARLWGPWVGREEDFFRACAALARSLDWEAVLHAGGAELRALVPVVRAALAQTRHAALPEALTLGTLQVLHVSARAIKVQGYSHLDPLDVPRELFDVLGHFDGRPTAEALAAASSAAGQEVPVGAVQMLVDFGVLSPK